MGYTRLEGFRVSPDLGRVVPVVQVHKLRGGRPPVCLNTWTMGGGDGLGKTSLLPVTLSFGPLSPRKGIKG